jgi:hypothetical protein
MVLQFNGGQVANDQGTYTIWRLTGAERKMDYTHFMKSRIEYIPLEIKL